MREYIFTPHEREVLRRYIETGVKERGFRTLMTRIRKNTSRLRDDMKIIEYLLKTESKGV